MLEENILNLDVRYQRLKTHSVVYTVMVQAYKSKKRGAREIMRIGVLLRFTELWLGRMQLVRGYHIYTLPTLYSLLRLRLSSVLLIQNSYIHKTNLTSRFRVEQSSRQ